MRRRRLLLVIGLAFIVYLVIGLYFTRDTWRDWLPGHAGKMESPPDPIIDGRPLQAWVKDLSDSNPDVRRPAVETLGNNGKTFPRADKVASALSKLLHDPDDQVRAAAVTALGKVHLWAQGELTPLLHTAQNDVFEVRVKALEALVPFIGADERVKEQFRLALEDKNPAVRDSVFELLTNAARPPSPLCSLLTDALKSKDDDVRLRALTAHCRWGPDAWESLESLCELLQDRNQVVRHKAAEATSRVTVIGGRVAGMPERETPPDPAELLDIEQRDSEKNAGAWLDERPEGGKIKAALIAALKDTDPQVRGHIAETISNLGRALVDAKPILLGFLKDPDALVRANSVSALGNFGPEARDAESYLLVMMKEDKTPRVRYRAIAALRKISTEPKILLRPFMDALQDPDERVRADASNGLCEFMANAGKLSDGEYKEVFFALVRHMVRDREESLKRDPTDVIMLHPGITPYSFWGVDDEVVQIIVPTLVEQLKESKGTEREVLILLFSRFLRTLGYAFMSERPEGFLSSPAGRRTRSAVQATVPLLTKDLSSPDESLRLSAVTALAGIGPEARPAVLELAKRLESRDKKEVMETLRFLRLFNRHAADAVPALVKQLRSKDVKIQIEVAKTLRIFGPAAKDAVPALLDAVRDQDSDNDLAESAAAALFSIDAPAAKRVLEENIHKGARRYLEWIIHPSSD
jgi:HEAT repeat protein